MFLWKKYGKLPLNYPCYPYLSGALHLKGVYLKYSNSAIRFFFSFQNNTKILYPFYIMDLKSWSCFEGGNPSCFEGGNPTS